MLSTRELYHATRRASVSVQRHGSTVSAHPRYRGKADLITYARRALLEHLDRDTLPRGSAPMLERVALAVMNRQVAPAQSLRSRLLTHIASKVRREAERRGLPTSLDLAKNGWARLGIHDVRRRDGLWTVLLHAAGWAKYSNRAGTWPTALSILGGQDDAGWWAVRVPGTISTVAAGLDWLEPAEVKRARNAGRTVLRQGDVWIVQRMRDAMADDDLPAGHRWDPSTRTITHAGHNPVHVPFAAIALRQSTIAASGNGRRRGD